HNCTHTIILSLSHLVQCCFFFNDTATTEIYTLSLHDALPICHKPLVEPGHLRHPFPRAVARELDMPCLFCDVNSHESLNYWLQRSEEHTSELQSLTNIVCRLLLEKKKNKSILTRKYAL